MNFINTFKMQILKKALILVIAVFTSAPIFSQEKSLTIEEAVVGQYRELYPEYLTNIQWKDAEHFTTIKSYRNIVIQELSNNTVDTLLTLDDINGMYNLTGLDSLRYIVSIHWINSNTFYNLQNNVLTVIDIDKKEISKSIKFNENAENTEYNPFNQLVTYTVNNNLFIHDGKEEIAITKDEDLGIVNGQTVHRSEFGITGGIFWSDKGEKLAYYHKDETMITDYPLVDVTQRVAKANNTKYPMAGMKSEEVKVAVYNPKTNSSIYLQTGEPAEQYLTNISWGPEAKFLYIQVLNREQNHMKLNQYDAETGAFVKTLFEEKHTKYVEPQHPIVFIKNKPNEFLYFSQKDGFQHLYKYNTDGKLIKQLTKGSWIIDDFIGFDQKGLNMLVYSKQNGPLEKQVALVDLKNGKSTIITPEMGQHTAFLNPYADNFIDGYSSIKVPHNYELRNYRGAKIRDIQIAENPLKDYLLGEMTIGTIKSADNKTDLYYRLITPPNFDNNKKYPVLVYVYGGPHAQLIDDSWLASSQLWLFYMAQKGYVVYTVDNRGSANRGLEFENVIHRNLGVAEMADQMKGIEFLKSLAYVDTNRIGIDGWSYGGFMTTNLILSHPETFKVAVAGGPVIDWKYYEVMYGERYMDTPDENPEGYANANLSARVDQLQGKLMIIHGAQDPTVVWQHSQVFLREAVKKGILMDYFIYPTHEHNIRGKDRVHLMRKITQYFDENL
ncbi:MAG: DPP IV N-terminal domain-containing protein [Bacteroidales bacterium]|nr:DPP IV N-terminal domain-containing protein [Bacteroidales bacterium]